MQQQRTMGTLRGLLILAAGALGGLTNERHMTQQHFDWAVGIRHYTVCVLAALCLHPPILHAQEVKHAPTVEQCRADQKLWWSKLESDNRDLIGQVSYKELRKWASEMEDCKEVDPERRSRYTDTDSEITATKAIRLADFLDRHHLWDQLYAEDAQGSVRAAVSG